MAKELKLTKKDRISVWLRSTFLQGSWNYERMQNDYIRLKKRGQQH